MQLVLAAARPVGVCPAGQDRQVPFEALTGFSHAGPVSTALCSLKAESMKMAGTAGTAGGSYSPQPPAAWAGFPGAGRPRAVGDPPGAAHGAGLRVGQAGRPEGA